MTLRYAMVAMVVLALALTACQGGDDQGSDGQASSTTNPHVQDLWIYDQLRTVNTGGEVVDHTAGIIEHFQASDTGEVVELIPGMTFTTVPGVAAWLKDSAGSRRDDAEIVAGIIENEFGTTFGALGTVDAAADLPIGIDDRVFIDMSFLDDAIEIGDLVAADFTLVQLMPTGDDAETELTPLDLFAHRASHESIQYSADAAGDPIVFGHELGRIVEGSEGPEIPPKAQPMMSGFRNGIKDCVKKPTVTGCIPGYLKNFGKGATQSLKQLEDQLPIPPPSERSPTRQPGPSVRDPLPCQSAACGASTGDPHLATFDGHRYGMQAVGEFVLARHDTDAVDIQLRTVPVGDIGRLSRVEVVAVGIGDQRIVVETEKIALSGEPLTEATLADSVSAPGFELEQWGTTTTIRTDTGHIITIERRSPALIDVIIGPAIDSSGWVGLLGDADGAGTNDLVARGGAAFANDLTFDQLYQEFVMSWRVTAGESLFDYADGESTATFTDLAYPREPFTIDDLSDADRRSAEAACRLADIVTPEVLDECVLDYAATGDIAYLLSAQVNDAVAGIVDGRLNPDGTDRTAGTDDPAGQAAPGSASREWYLTSENVLRDGIDSAVLECPASDGASLTSLWGDEVYTSDSAVCRAGVHSGVITAEEGGAVRVTRLPGQTSYPSTTRNGITSRPWDRPWSSSFSVSAE